MSTISELALKVENLEIEEVLVEVEKLIDQKENPLKILAECRAGMEGVGKRFEAGEYFVADLMLSADIFNQVVDILGPSIKYNEDNMEGKVLIATVEDDIHDIGKNLVASMLKASGFNVIDIGVNVPATVICEEVKAHQPDIVALSCLLTSTMDAMENTITVLKKQGFNVKTIVGGAPVTAKIAADVGADAYGQDAYDAVIQCKKLIGGDAVA